VQQLVDAIAGEEARTGIAQGLRVEAAPRAPCSGGSRTCAPAPRT
jgi:hypothetical protein